MELTILLALYILGFGFLLYGFYNRSTLPVLFSAVLIMSAGAILFTDGYDSRVSCTIPGNPDSCRELTNLAYDSNGNISSITQSVVKMNSANSRLSYSVGLGSFFFGAFAGFVALLGRIRGQ